MREHLILQKIVIYIHKVENVQHFEVSFKYFSQLLENFNSFNGILKNIE